MKLEDALKLSEVNHALDKEPCKGRACRECTRILIVAQQKDQFGNTYREISVQKSVPASIYAYDSAREALPEEVQDKDDWEPL